jgi:hypothetical protein
MFLRWKTHVDGPAISYTKQKLNNFFNVFTASIAEPRYIVIQIAHFKVVNNFKAVNKYIDINLNWIPYKLTILHYMYQLF